MRKLTKKEKNTMDKKVVSQAIDTSTDWAKRSKIEFADAKNKRHLFSLYLPVSRGFVSQFQDSNVHHGLFGSTASVLVRVRVLPVLVSVSFKAI